MSGSGRLDVAVRRLERAASLLEQRLGHRVAEAGAQAGGLFDLDRARLAADLDASRARERELTEAAAEALASVDKALADVEVAMGTNPTGQDKGDSMAQVIVQINGKPYGVGCEDGQESHVRSLATVIDAKVGEVAHEAGALGETRLMLLGGLMLADEVKQLQSALATANARTAHLETESEAIEARAIAALEAAAQKLEAMAGR